MFKQLIYTFLIAHFILDFVANYLNIKHLKLDIPSQFNGVYDQEKYQKSQEYLKSKTTFSIISSIVNLGVLFVIFETGFLNIIDIWSRSYSLGAIYTGLLFFSAYFLVTLVISIPFSIYNTFSIEARFGFNTTTVKTFILDKIKGLILSALFGLPLLALVLYFFSFLTPYTWLYVWIAISAFQLVMLYIYPSFIMPLFNKFEPLKNQGLKEKIVQCASDLSFPVKDIFEMDGSKRSKKSNAFFAGFGRSRRVVFFDTLLNNHSDDEILGIFAHEVGHYKCKHLFKQITLSIGSLGLTLYLLNMFLLNTQIFSDFGIQYASVYMSLLFFSFLITPLNVALGIFSSILSRKFEFEADAFAVKTTENKDAMIQALKTLSVDNLSNLTPHPVKVFLEYSHPPVLDRIKAIESL